MATTSQTLFQQHGNGIPWIRKANSSSRFLELPIEIRLMIYRHALPVKYITLRPVGYVTLPSSQGSKKPLSQKRLSAYTPPLLLVCQQVRTEFEPVFYDMTRVYIRLPLDWYILKAVQLKRDAPTPMQENDERCAELIKSVKHVIGQRFQAAFAIPRFRHFIVRFDRLTRTDLLAVQIRDFLEQVSLANPGKKMFVDIDCGPKERHKRPLPRFNPVLKEVSEVKGQPYLEIKVMWWDEEGITYESESSNGGEKANG